MGKHCSSSPFSHCLSFFSLCLLLAVFCAHAKPRIPAPKGCLHTNSRWIVNDKGTRVKLACTNWASHLEPGVAEGLSFQPLDNISRRISSMGFNCVRLTWPLYLVTNNSFSSQTVRQSLKTLGLVDAIAGFKAFNPSLLDHTLLHVFQSVVSNLVMNRLMVILDNHTTKPMWCCSTNDGNGFFGDKYLNTTEWLTGLTRMATMYKGNCGVVGMSLRNELRGANQNTNSWYSNMVKGANAVHLANKNLLIILGGLNFDTDLSFVLERPVKVAFSGMIVYELHLYAFTKSKLWESTSANQACGLAVSSFMRAGGSLADEGKPLFVSEYGADQSGGNEDDNRYIDCFLGQLAEKDLDWALWTVVGSYYMRDNIATFEEIYGLLSKNWSTIRNTSFLQKISSIQSPFGGPGLVKAKSHELLYHPKTGQCIVQKLESPQLGLGPCTNGSGLVDWTRAPQSKLMKFGQNTCLQAEVLGGPAIIGSKCTTRHSNLKWRSVSESKLHLQSNLSSGAPVCLDIGFNNTLITANCRCLGKVIECDPTDQWFKIITTTRKL